MILVIEKRCDVQLNTTRRFPRHPL